jgi:hypothetical protein
MLSRARSVGPTGSEELREDLEYGIQDHYMLDRLHDPVAVLQRLIVRFDAQGKVHQNALRIH